MAKRQIRLNPGQLPHHLHDFTGNPATLVLRTGRALQVTPVTVNEHGLVVTDMLGKEQSHPFASIVELILEQSA